VNTDCASKGNPQVEFLGLLPAKEVLAPS